MRWKSKKGYYRQGRTISKFLLFPCIIDKEWRWLENTRINQVYNGDGHGWENTSWAKEEGK